jgi:hypothetical protein
MPFCCFGMRGAARTAVGVRQAARMTAASVRYMAFLLVGDVNIATFIIALPG